MIFPCPAQAPEIFQIPLDDLDPAGLPPRGTPEFEQAVIGRYALDYAVLGPSHVKEAAEQYKAVVKRFPDHQVGEMAEEALTRIGHEEMRAAVDGGLRMDAVMYMQAAQDRFAKLDQAKVGQIVMEIALLGRNGLEINKPAVRYTLQNLEGEFSGLALLAYMHVGFRMFDAKGDAGTGLDREYEAAVKMRRER
ncbi:MAG: hypothetical protein PHW25_19825 [Zoogloea sp.]|uniref:hypothetical protein n=1 Tax=Zoogloea sp. TaxID=49181 RepID=UPI00262D031E|nr:hypothetical protein [Zoogloea sp.]MDD3329335.1 hypothetical protein [Zoogloea sp.]